MKKNTKIEVKCETLQKQKINSRAELLGMSASTFLLFLGLHANVDSPRLNLSPTLEKKYIKRKKQKIKTPNNL